MANAKPTVNSLDQRMGGVERRLGQPRRVPRPGPAVHPRPERGQHRTVRTAVGAGALGSLGGLDGIVGGLAEVAEMLAPVRQFAPPSTALPLEPGVARALGSIRRSLGGDRRELDFTSLTTRWDGPVGFIGEAVQPDYYDTDGQEPGR